MTISFSKNFIKLAKNLSSAQRKKLTEHVELFVENPLHPTLRNYQLKGKYKQYGSINVTGDIRALYLMRDTEIIFDIVGTHSRLYQ
jgi:addiction module RelE/StbE family toxin